MVKLIKPLVRGDVNHEILIAFAVSLSMLSTGFHVSWAGPAIHYLTTSPEAPFKLPANHISSLASFICLGGVFGALIAYYVAEKWSRCKLITLNAVIFLACACVFTFWQSLYPFYLARVLAGVGGAISFGIAPLYICEIASPNIRGTLCFILHGAAAIGGVLVYYLIPFTSLTTFSTICIGVAIAQLTLSIFLPESPYFLLLKGDEFKARRVLKQLRNKQDVADELDVLKNLVKDQTNQPKVEFLDMILNSKHRKAVLISSILSLAQQASGNISLQAYSQTIFATAALPISNDVCGIIYQGIGALALLISGSLIDSFGRRSLLILSSIAVTLSLVILGGYYFLQYIHILEIGAYPVIPLAFMIMHISGSALGVVPLPYIISNELMETCIRPLGGVMVTYAGSFGAAASLVMFQILDENVGKFAPFWVNAILFSILGGVVLIYLPETKGRTLDEIKIEK